MMEVKMNQDDSDSMYENFGKNSKSFVTSVTPLKCPCSSQPVLTEPFGV